MQLQDLVTRWILNSTDDTHPSTPQIKKKKKAILAAYSTINIHIGNLNFYKIRTSNNLNWQVSDVPITGNSLRMRQEW